MEYFHLHAVDILTASDRTMDSLLAQEINKCSMYYKTLKFMSSIWSGPQQTQDVKTTLIQRLVSARGKVHTGWGPDDMSLGVIQCSGGDKGQASLSWRTVPRWTQGIEPMLDKCWSTVPDTGPTSIQTTIGSTSCIYWGNTCTLTITWKRKIK